MNLLHLHSRPVKSGFFNIQRGPLPAFSKYCLVLVSLLLINNILFAQHKDMTLTFNEEGKLLSGYLPRYNPKLNQKDCKYDTSVRIRVLLPSNYFTAEKKKIDTMATNVYKAINDDNSMFSILLNCQLAKKADSLKNFVIRERIEDWDFDTIKGLFPSELSGYIRFINALRNRNLKLLDSLKQFSPYQLKIKGQLLDTSCYGFIPVNDSDPCDCIKENNKYVALEFRLPSGLLLKDIAVDSFQLLKAFPMKEAAINWYNNMIDTSKAQLIKLKLLQQTIFKRKELIEGLINAIDTLSALDEYCKKSEEIGILQERVANRFCENQAKLELELGGFKCKDSCNQNVLFCSPALANWVLKLFWLNGDLIRLNPFNFTMNKSFATTATALVANNKKKEQLRKNALIQLDFWDAAISHLKDSVLLETGISIDSNNVLLKRLLYFRDSVLAIANRNLPDSPNNDAADNAEKLLKFITISQVNYQGWLVPYQSAQKNKIYSPDKIWLRNYYLDQMPNPLRNKYHFTYPEDENLTLLLHNIPAGTQMDVSESFTSFADSAAFTVIAGELVSQAASLYSSVQPTAAILKKLLKPANTPSPSQNIDLSNSIITATIIGFDETKLGLANLIQAKKSLNAFLNKNKNNDVEVNIIVTDTATKTDVLSQTFKNVNVTNALMNQILEIMQQQQQLKIKNCLALLNNACYINYIKSLYTFIDAPLLIDAELESDQNKAPLLYTGKYQLRDKQSPYTNIYKLRTITKVTGETDRIVNVDSSYISVGRFRYLQTAAGIAYTPGAGFITSVDTTGGGFKINRDEDRFRVIIGFRWYPAGLYNQKNPASLARDKRWLHRLNILVATSIPKPRENIYLGGGFDLVPGLNLTGGIHWQQRNRYSILNNQVESRQIGYRGHFFYAVTVDPALLVTAITTLFK